MPVDVKGKGSGCMTEVALYSFDVVTCADAVDGIGMTKVVYPRIGKTDALYDALEAVEDRTVGDIAPNSLVNTKPLSSHAGPASNLCVACCTF